MNNGFFGSSRYLTVGLVGFGHDVGPYGGDNDGVKTLQTVEQQADVMTGGDEEDVDSVTVGAGESVPFKFPSAFIFPITGSIALRRLSSLLIVGDVMPYVLEMYTSGSCRPWPR